MKTISYRRYTIYFLLFFFIVTVALFHYINNIRNIYEKGAERFQSIVVSTQVERIHGNVDTLINHLNFEKQSIQKDMNNWFFQANEKLNALDSKGKLSDTLETLIQEGPDGIYYRKYDFPLHAYIYNNQTNMIEFSNDTEIKTNDIISQVEIAHFLEQHEMSLTKPVHQEKRTLILGINDIEMQTYIKEKLLNYVTQINVNASEEESIWMNEIQNFEGGDNFAIRLVYPSNYPIKDQLLSTTNTEYPYKKELNELIKYGESANQYYELDTQSNSRFLKVSYTKLYNDYNWTISSNIRLKYLEKYKEEYHQSFLKEMQIQTLLGTFFIFLMMSATLVIGGKIFSKIEKSKNEILQERIDFVEKHYESLEQKKELINKFLHDTKNHYLYIYGLAKEKESEEIVKYIDSMGLESTHYDFGISTGNKTVDLLVNDKMEIMKRNDIKFNYKIQKATLNFIENKDLVSLLSNLFDNAIEHISEKKDRQIDFFLYDFNNGYIVIKMVNSCEKQPIKKEDRWITSKSNAEQHGYGLKIIKSIVQKYAGEIDCIFDSEKESFHVILLIPIKEEF
ncbi:sensor histidine kinase [Clostridium cadaveris]|uniref:sensor histidine kinase n=1 Tax=Clostridium cadaveris TaxID=1529 RepID=UPI0015B67861|nr:GHKL domain-containing protein [Clostridium cadaveris]NWK10803.1 GHKL domain-containing protein [Clostridium cadaveris]